MTALDIILHILTVCIVGVVVTTPVARWLTDAHTRTEER